MSKTIGELTLNEVAKVCEKCKTGNYYDCPFYDVNVVNCANFTKEQLKHGLDKEWEEENETRHNARV